MKSRYLAIASIVFILIGCGSGNSDNNDSEYSDSNISENSDVKSLSNQTNNTKNLQTRKLSKNSSQSNIRIAWEFDYPIGNKGYDSNGNKVPIDEHISGGSNYNKDRNEEYNLGKNIYGNNSRSGSSSTTWYNISDVGNFVNLKYTKGLHPGEDWNYAKAGDDAGKPVYSIANGIIKEISKVYSSSEEKAGWKIIIEHTLPDNSKIYSIYLHLTSANETQGNIVSNKNDFTIKEGDPVYKGNAIARLATDMTYFPNSEHLHFEIRNILIPNQNKIYTIIRA